MGDYQTHRGDGMIVGLILAVIIAYIGIVELNNLKLGIGGAVGAFVLVTIGSSLPDTDHHASIPRRKAVKIVSAVGIIGVVFYATQNWQTILRIVSQWLAGLVPQIPVELMAIGIIVISIFVVQHFAPSVVDTVTGPHRGWTHSPGWMAVLMALLAIGLWVKSAEFELAGQNRILVSVGIPLFLLIGVLTHLARDGEL